VNLCSLKTVIRCADFERSHDFYTRVLALTAAEEWTEPQGRGCIFAVGDAGLEIYGMTRQDPRFQEAFAHPLAGDKIDLQIRTDSLNAWAERLRGLWPFEGPATLPWGQRWIQLRDPDGLLIALYEEAP